MKNCSHGLEDKLISVKFQTLIRTVQELVNSIWQYNFSERVACSIELTIISMMLEAKIIREQMDNRHNTVVSSKGSNPLTHRIYSLAKFGSNQSDVHLYFSR